MKGTITKTINGTVIVLVREIGDKLWLVEPMRMGGVTLCAQDEIQHFINQNN